MEERAEQISKEKKMKERPSSEQRIVKGQVTDVEIIRFQGSGRSRNSCRYFKTSTTIERHKTALSVLHLGFSIAQHYLLIYFNIICIVYLFYMSYRLREY